MPKLSFEAEYFEGPGKCLQHGRQQFRHLVLYFRLKLGNRSDFRCLGVGCALGHLVKDARDLGMDAFGVDISRYALERAVVNQDFLVQGDSCELPFGDECFDVVTALEVVEHLPEPERCLYECYRILKHGGMLIISTPSEKGRIIEPPHISEHPPGYWIDYLKAIGFRHKAYYLPLVVSEYDYTEFPYFLRMPSAAKRIFLISIGGFRLLPLKARFYLEEPMRKLLGIYFARRKNAFYVVAFKS